MPHEPFSKSPEESVAQREAVRRALVKAYKGTFGSAHGILVLADLKRQFGFDRCEADTEAVSDNIIARRTCMKAPLFHIERMLKTTLRKTPKPPRALSA